jgi:hypothetical protein
MRQVVEVGGHRPCGSRAISSRISHEARIPSSTPYQFLAEEHVPRDLAAEEDAILAHLALEVRGPVFS